MSKINVVTVDGPSASGKGSLSRKIAQIFNLSILDSGSLYRLYAFFVEEGINMSSIPEIIQNNINPSFFDILFSPDIYLPLIGFVVLILISYFLGKKFFKK